MFAVDTGIRGCEYLFQFSGGLWGGITLPRRLARETVFVYPLFLQPLFLENLAIEIGFVDPFCCLFLIIIFLLFSLLVLFVKPRKTWLWKIP